MKFSDSHDGEKSFVFMSLRKAWAIRAGKLASSNPVTNDFRFVQSLWRGVPPAHHPGIRSTAPAAEGTLLFQSFL